MFILFFVLHSYGTELWNILLFLEYILDGSVYLQSQLDFETKSNYTLRIVAQDLGSPPKSSMTNVFINVINDVIRFSNDTYEINITTSTSLKVSVLDVTVNVPNATFSLKGNVKPINDMTLHLFRIKQMLHVCSIKSKFWQISSE